jgi:uncharacterized membrane protein
MTWLRLIGDTASIILGIYAAYKFFTGDKSERETLWYGLLLIAVLI